MPAGSPTVTPIRGFRTGLVRVVRAIRGKSTVAGRARSASAGSAARRIRAMPAVGAAAMLYAVAVRQLVAQAALEASALAGELRRVEAELLLLRHLDRHRLERVEPGRAAERAAAGPVAAEHFRRVAHADLAHLDADVEVPGQVAHQLAE